MTEVHLCIKKHFGTNETTKQFYSLAKQKYSIGILQRILIKLNIKKQIWISVKNSASAIAQITSYYIDLIKDIVFITFFFEFLPKKISVNSFEYNMFFLLCFSVLLPGEWICFIIQSKNHKVVSSNPFFREKCKIWIKLCLLLERKIDLTLLHVQ